MPRPGYLLGFDMIGASEEESVDEGEGSEEEEEAEDKDEI
jgi:hypothetical protein